MKDMLTAIEAVFIGISLTMFVYWALDKVTNLLPGKAKKALKPWVFIGPVVLLIGSFLVVPAIQSIRLSFMEEDLDGSTK